ncbi:MAG: hypothetical protein AAFZ91_04565 [Pseudomonadota bacterium]
MKTMMLALAGIALLAACEPSPGEPEPYSDLGGALRVTFSDNPEVADGQCNPLVEYALRSEDPALRLNVAYLIDDETFASSGFAIVDRSDDGDLNILTASDTMSMFDPFEGACSDITVKVHDFTCQAGESDENVPCPDTAFVGTDMFASFTE